MKVEIHQGTLPECLDDWPEHHFAAILSDPPYGLGEVKSPAALLAAWLAGQDGAQGPGMLSRAWDIVPPPRLHAELLRILKPGGLFMSYQGRASHWAAISQELAGFKMLPSFVRIHGGAMALGQNTGKAIDKAKGLEREVVGTYAAPDGRTNIRGRSRGVTVAGDSWTQDPANFEPNVTAPASPLAAAFDGHASAVKVAHEPILCARKPLDGTGAEVAERHGIGGFNVKAGRIPSGEALKNVKQKRTGGVARGAMESAGDWAYSSAGRYPSTVLFSHLEDCGATRCADGCPVAVVDEQAAAKGIHSAGQARMPVANNPGHSAVYGKPVPRLTAHRFGDESTPKATRVYYQGRASRRERHAGAEHLLWVRDADHADGWRLVDEAEFNRVGDEAAEAARQSPRYAEMMAQGYMRTSHGSDRSEILADSATYGKGINKVAKKGPSRMILDPERLDAGAFVEAARESGRCKGNSHLAVKAVDGGVYLAKLLLQPTIDSVEPVLLVPFCGSGSEIIAALLAGWTRIVAYEMSGQMCELARARVSWWQERIEAGHRGDALDMLRGWGTAPDVEPVANAGQMSVFDVT